MGSNCCKLNSENNFLISPINIPEDLQETRNIPLLISRAPTFKFSKVNLPKSKKSSDDAIIFRFNVKEKLLKHQNSLTPDEVEKSNRMMKLNKANSFAEVETSMFDVSDVITEEEKDMIIEIFYNLDLWSGFEAVNIETLVNLFVQVKVPENEELFKFGNDANLIYIIASGAVKITSEDDEPVEILKDRDYFGIEGLEENQKRTCSATTTQPTILLCLTGEMYRNISQQIYLHEQYEMINIIKKLPLFKYMDLSYIREICRNIIQKKYSKDTIIVGEGELLDRVYLIQEGSIQVTKSYKRVYKLSSSECFGDITLLIRTPSYFTYSVDRNDATILEIPYRVVKDVLGREFVRILIFRLFINAIKRSRIIFEEKKIADLNYFLNIFKLRYYTTDEIVYQSNIQKNKKICILISGKLKKQTKGEIVAKTEDIFGEEILDSMKDLECNIISVDITLTLEANWNDLLKNLKSEEIISKENIYETVCRLKKIAIFSSISELKLFQLAKRMTLEKFRTQQQLMRTKDVDKLYIIKTGKVHVFRENEFIREMEAGSVFGEIQYENNSNFPVSFIAVGELECYTLTREAFSDINDTVLKKYLQSILALNDIYVELNDLFYIKNLGSGKFGKVLLVHNKKNIYALKCANIKTICGRENLMQYYLNEKNIMLKTDYPFILKLVKTLKTDDYLFYLLEYIDGITLKSYIDKRKKKDINNSFETAFFGAILLCVVNYIHRKRIIHRDIKPENCMIDRNGYLKVIDFGVAKELLNKDFTSTCCGTPHYMPPEVISGEGYSLSADYWSIGIVMFEIFYGYRPFGEGLNNVVDIYSEILHKKLLLPYDQKFKDINNFFKILLSKNIIQRICNFNHIKAHPFFNQIDFESLTDFSIKPPYIPDSFIESINAGIYSIFSNKDKPLLSYFQEFSSSSYNPQEIHEYNQMIKRQKTWLSQF